MMSLKILGGKFGGRLLKSPKTSPTRPTTARLKKSVFDMLQPIIQEATFLDLFSGSGAIGIEALSRGAKQVIFVDAHLDAIRTITANLSLFNLTTQAVVMKCDAITALQRLQNQHLTFDIIYADPPYEEKKLFYRQLLESIDQSSLLAQGGLLLIESGEPSPLDKLTLYSLRPLPLRYYGPSILHPYQKT